MPRQEDCFARKKVFRLLKRVWLVRICAKTFLPEVLETGAKAVSQFEDIVSRYPSPDAKKTVCFVQPETKTHAWLCDHGDPVCALQILHYHSDHEEIVTNVFVDVRTLFASLVEPPCGPGCEVQSEPVSINDRPARNLYHVSAGRFWGQHRELVARASLLEVRFFAQQQLQAMEECEASS